MERTTKATATGRGTAALALLVAAAMLIAWPGAATAEEAPPALGWGNWVVVWDQPRPANAWPASDTQPEAVTDADLPPAPQEEWVFVYDLWQLGISSLSGLGPISPIQGRREVLQHAEEIKQWAPDYLELLVAASIAHQASDFKDRPFGTDALESVWRALIDDNISVGIAQLRRDEIAAWAPYLRGVDLLTPEMAIRVMIAKLKQSDTYILYRHPKIPDTDRFMLLALAQNTASAAAMRSTVDFFVDVARGDWTTMITSERAKELDWQEQLRLVLVHLDWLIEQGWAAPDGLDRDYWSRIAFSEPQ
jgi:hypothetical protein